MKNWYATMEEFRKDAEAEGLDVDKTFKALYDENNTLAGTFSVHLGEVSYKDLRG